MNQTQKAKLLRALRRAEPKAIRALAGDGEAIEVAVRRTSRGARWTQAIETIDELSWTRLELLDDKGKLLGVVHHDAPAEEIESIESVPTPASRDMQLVKLILHAQDMVLSRHTEALRPMLDATRTVLKDLSEQNIVMRREASRQGEAAADLGEQLARVADSMSKLGAANGGAEGPSSIGEILRLLPLLGRALPAGAPPPPAPPPPRPTSRPAAARAAARPPNGSPPRGEASPRRGDGQDPPKGGES